MELRLLWLMSCVVVVVNGCHTDRSSGPADVVDGHVAITAYRAVPYRAMRRGSTDATSSASARCEWSEKPAAADGCCEDQVRGMLLCVTTAQEVSPEEV